MLTYILVGLALIVAAFLLTAALQPAGFRTARKINIAAPPDAIFGWVNDLHRWQEFSPWAKMDPNASTTFEGPLAGVGASFSWEGNKVGSGRMTIVESKPNQLVRFRLEFLKPFAATNTAEFTFEPDGQGTTVTWAMTGERNFMMKAFGLIVNCDKMCGSQFEQGLATLKSLSETPVAV
jgi:carbon monoxide dehydrogenase subunit G